MNTAENAWEKAPAGTVRRSRSRGVRKTPPEPPKLIEKIKKSKNRNQKTKKTTKTWSKQK